MPLAFTISLLSWGTLEFPKGYAKAGTQQQTLDNIKWGADWLVKAVGASTNGSSNSSGIVYQTGNLTTDQTVRLPSAGLWQGSPCSPLSSSLRARHKAERSPRQCGGYCSALLACGLMHSLPAGMRGGRAGSYECCILEQSMAVHQSSPSGSCTCFHGSELAAPYLLHLLVEFVKLSSQLSHGHPCRTGSVPSLCPRTGHTTCWRQPREGPTWQGL